MSDKRGRGRHDPRKIKLQKGREKVRAEKVRGIPGG